MLKFQKLLVGRAEVQCTFLPGGGCDSSVELLRGCFSDFYLKLFIKLQPSDWYGIVSNWFCPNYGIPSTKHFYHFIKIK